MSPYTINPPESEVAFEKLCLALLKRHWSRPGLERFAKKGEEQFGVDIFDTLGETPLYGAQCKLKEQWKSLEPSEIRDEVEKAKTFPSRLDHYAILTTGKISGAAQLTIQAVNQQHRAAGLFTVELFTWEKITELIRQYPEVEKEFYGGLRSEELGVVTSKLDYIASLAESVTSSAAKTEIDALIDEARTHITPREAQIATLLLNRIQRTRTDELSDWHRFRILTNLGAASLMLGRGPETARYFLDAKALRPNDELAITNEVLAYHLLGQSAETRERAAKAIERFPNSARLRSLWIQSWPPDKKYEELLHATPGHLRKDAEVASALARRALAAAFIDRAVDHAKDAVADKPQWSQAHLLLAQTYFGRVAMVERSLRPLKEEEKQTAFNNSANASDSAISIADNEGDSYTKAQALALKADIALLQGRKEEAATLARESFATDSTELNGRIALAQASVSMGNLDEAIGILEETLARSNSAANVCFMLGQALMTRGKDQDINRAIEVFTAARVDNLSRELVDPIILGTVRALTRAKRFTEIPEYLLRPETAASGVLVATIKAYSALKQSFDAQAGQFMDEALSLRQATDTLTATDFLARTLLEAGRLSDALPLLQELFNAQLPDFDAGLLLNCASRLRLDDVTLETCQTLYDRGIRDWRFLEFESQYLEEYDFKKAISRLQEFIAANPTHRIAKLRLSTIGIRYGLKEFSELPEEDFPSVQELPMNYAMQAVHVLQWQGKAKLAIDYAYRLLRAHYSELEAHKAYIASLVPEPQVDIPAAMETVEIGSAVQYAEVGGGMVGWFVIENTDTPNSEFEEVPAKSDVAQELLGKKVGDSFTLAKSDIKDRQGKIEQILSKYTRRFQAIGEQMQLKFGSQSMIQTVRVPQPEKLTSADLQPILDSVKARSEAVSKIREIYRTNSVTLHMYGNLFGQNSYQGLTDLATSDGQFVRCAPLSMELLSNGLSTLGTKSTIVLDLTALATLRLLGIADRILGTTAFRFVITPATFTELQEMRIRTRFSGVGGTLYYEKGQHFMAETTPEQVEKQKAAVEEFMQCIEKNTTVIAVPQLANFPIEKREPLEKILGLYGLESAQLALTPGYIWWTDDLVAAEVAKSELNSERIWTQAFLEHIANLGLIDRSVADESYAELIGLNYQATHFTSAVMIAALRLSKGSVSTFPMIEMLEAYALLPSSNRKAAFQLLAEFILRLAREPLLPETKCIAIKALLDKFPSDATSSSQLASFRVQCARLMTLNPVAQVDFVKCFDGWKRERKTLKIL